MKKLVFVLPIAVLLIALSLTPAFAGVDWEDPALCVAGQWLVVNAAHATSVTVVVPEGTRYGDQTAGGCAAAGPAVPFIQNVETRGNGNSMSVEMPGASATTPSVTATYGAASETKSNDGKGTVKFHFKLR